MVFDASAKSSTGVSLNDSLLVGSTVHLSLVDILLHFRLHRIALTADISKMYHAIELVPSDRDLHINLCGHSVQKNCSEISG